MQRRSMIATTRFPIPFSHFWHTAKRRVTPAATLSLPGAESSVCRLLGNRPISTVQAGQCYLLDARLYWYRLSEVIKLVLLAIRYAVALLC